LFGIKELAYYWLLVEAIYGLIMFVLFKYKSQQPYFLFTTFNHQPKIFKLIKATWSQNFFGMFSKHLDLVVLNVFFEPTTVALYRPIKSIINFVYNLGNSMSLIFINQSKTNSLIKRPKKYLTLFFFLIIFITLYFTTLFITGLEFITTTFNDVGDIHIYFFLSFLSCLFIFINRFISLLTLKRLETNKLVFISFIESLSFFIILLICCLFSSELSGPLAMFINSILISLIYIMVLRYENNSSNNI